MLCENEKSLKSRILVSDVLKTKKILVECNEINNYVIDKIN